MIFLYNRISNANSLQWPEPLKDQVQKSLTRECSDDKSCCRVMPLDIPRGQDSNDSTWRNRWRSPVRCWSEWRDNKVQYHEVTVPLFSKRRAIHFAHSSDWAVSKLHNSLCSFLEAWWKCRWTTNSLSRLPELTLSQNCQVGYLIQASSLRQKNQWISNLLDQIVMTWLNLTNSMLIKRLKFINLIEILIRQFNCYNTFR